MKEEAKMGVTEIQVSICSPAQEKLNSFKRSTSPGDGCCQEETRRRLTLSARMRHGFFSHERCLLPPYGLASAHLSEPWRSRRRRRRHVDGRDNVGVFEREGGRGEKMRGRRKRCQGSDAGAMSMAGGRGEKSHCGSSTIWQVMKHFVM